MNLLSLASRFPVTITLFILMAFFFINIKRADARLKNSKESFLEKESRANGTRRKSLDTVDFIVIPYDELPMDVATEDETIQGCIRDIESLRDDRIANFTGITNTDLKLKYGAPNITDLSRFDNNFTSLCRILQEWGKRLNELNKREEALTVLEFAIRIKSDVSASYYLCARLYNELGRSDRIAWLKRTAQGLDSAMRPTIIRKLDEQYPDIKDTDTAVN